MVRGTTSPTVSTWFFYYDPRDRLTEVVYTPDTSTPTTYQVFQLVWLEDELVAYVQTNLPGATVSRRYVVRDDSSRPIEMWDWPASGDTTRMWAVNQTAYGLDNPVVGVGSIYQPVLFPGEHLDTELRALGNGSAQLRPGFAQRVAGTYDPFIARDLATSGGGLVTAKWEDENEDPPAEAVVIVDTIDTGACWNAGLCFPTNGTGGRPWTPKPPQPSGGGSGGGGNGSTDEEHDVTGWDADWDYDHMRTWRCTTKCAVTGSERQCTGWVPGDGTGKTEPDACKAAKKDAAAKAPRGCSAKHCRPCECRRSVIARESEGHNTEATPDDLHVGR